ncbi:MAG TPA: PKD domain-containing protein [Planctomycetota bacterium]|nr:PKD domain-containing protein [Planctomycetota bacterium]
MKRYLLSLWAALLCASVLAIDAPVWQQFHGADGGHAGTSNATLNPAQIALRWSADPAALTSLGISAFNRASTPCVSADGSIVAAYADNAPYTAGAGKLVAFDAFTGDVKWSLAVPAHNNFLSSSSAAFRNGYFYWTGSNGSGVSRVFKIHAQTGSTAASSGGWIATLPGSVDIVNCSPLVTDSKVYVSTYGGFAPAAKHFVLNVSDGSIAWSNSDGGQGQGAFAFDAARNLVYQTVHDGTNHKLRAYHADTGAIVWTAPWNFTYTPFQIGITLANDKLYVQDNNFSTGFIYVADAANNGALIDSIATVEDGGCCVTVDPSGNMYYYCAYEPDAFFNPGDGKAMALNADGSDRWAAVFDLGGGAGGSAAWADGHVFVGQQNGNNLYVLKDTDGSIVKTIPGSGPVAFGERTFFTIGFDGKLYAYSTSSDFATSVESSSTLGAPYNDPNTALGRPTIDTKSDIDGVTDWPVVPCFPAYKTNELVTLDTGGSLELKFDHPVKRDPNNAFGADLIVFGNVLNGRQSGFWTNGDPTAFVLTSTQNHEPGKIFVSANGTTWEEVSGVFADTHAPTLGRVYSPQGPGVYWGAPTDATLALDPAVTAASMNGQTVAQVATRYGRSAGGTRVSLSGTSFTAIQYIRFENVQTATFTEIDAVADARVVADTIAPDAAFGVNAAPGSTTMQVSWTNPLTTDFAGVIVIRRKGSAPSGPSNSIGAYAGSTLGGGTVVYCGTGTSLNEIGLESGTLYYYSVHAFDSMLNYSAAATALATTSNNPPQMVSGASASATTVFQNGTVNFSASASDADGDALAYTWDFGDGAVGFGASASHQFNQLGTFTVLLTVSDGKGGQAQSSITVSVVIDPNDVDGDGVPNSTDKDNDNDGVPNDVEVALGTDPLSAASTPAGGPVAGGGAGIAIVTRAQINLNFARGNSDKITLSGGIPVSGGVILSGKRFSVYAGGAGATFTLNAKGVASGTRGNSVRVRAKSNVLGPQTVTFTAKLAGNFAAALADEGLTSADIPGAARTVQLVVIFDGKIYSQNQTLRYTAKAGKTGSAR